MRFPPRRYVTLWVSEAGGLAVTEESKAKAIKALLESTPFRRADLLRALLKYLHEQASAGRGHEITEYEIATRVLGRSADFSPETDSSVRTRMLALRRKIDEFYAGEGAGADLRVEVPKGAYSLRYLDNVPAESKPLPAPRRDSFLRGAATGAGLALAILSAIFLLRAANTGGGDRLLFQAWGPMLKTGANVVISIGTPASMFVRDFGDAEPPVGDPIFRPEIPRTPEFENWYRSARNAPLGRNAILHPQFHGPLWGDAAAAVVVSRMLGEHRIPVEILPGARLHAVAFRDRNAVLIGRPEYSDAVRLLTPEAGLAVEYNGVKRALGVHNRRPGQGEPEWWFSTEGLRHGFGLISVLALDGYGKRKTIMFSGINSDGAEAGARFLTSADGLAQLAAEFEKLGLKTWPPSYQVVVRTESVDTYSLQAKFEFLRVLE